MFLPGGVVLGAERQPRCPARPQAIASHRVRCWWPLLLLLQTAPSRGLSVEAVSPLGKAAR
eukprot:10941351-Alexandrium_andersonii.AAC.1